MSAGAIALVVVGGLLAVGCIMLGWWFRGDTPCEDHPTARDQVEEPARGEMPADEDDGDWFLHLGDRTYNDLADDRPSLMRSGNHGHVLHREGCELLVRPEPVTDYGDMRKCTICFEDDGP